MAVGAVVETEGVAVLVPEDGEEVHLAGGVGPFLGDPLVGIAGGEEFFVEIRRVVDVPAVAGGIGVEGDGLAGGLAEGGIGEVGKGNRNTRQACINSSERSALLETGIVDICIKCPAFRNEFHVPKFHGDIDFLAGTILDDVAHTVFAQFFDRIDLIAYTST